MVLAAQDKGGADCEVCFGDAETCGCREEDGRSLCEMSDSACSLQDGDSAAASSHETWLLQEYCGLGTLQVPCPLLPFHASNNSCIRRLSRIMPSGHLGSCGSVVRCLQPCQAYSFRQAPSHISKHTCCQRLSPASKCRVPKDSAAPHERARV